MSNGSSRLVTNHIHDGDDAGGDGGANEFFGFYPKNAYKILLKVQGKLYRIFPIEFLWFFHPRHHISKYKQLFLGMCNPFDCDIYIYSQNWGFVLRRGSKLI